MRSPSETLWSLVGRQRLRFGSAVVAMLLTQAHLFAVPLVPRAAIDLLVDGAPTGWLAAGAPA